MSKVTSDSQKKINKAIRYSKKFENFTYKLCGNKLPCLKKDCAPFWFANEEVPDILIVKKRGINCVGLANLVRRYMGLQVPGKVTGQKLTKDVKEWPGSTSAWFHYLKTEKRLERIDFDKVYPKGTLLLQDFNPKDKGHVAFTINSSKKGLMESKIIHALSDKDKITGKSYKHVVIEKVKDYYKYKRFTHVCLPQNWILKN